MTPMKDVVNARQASLDVSRYKRTSCSFTSFFFYARNHIYVQTNVRDIKLPKSLVLKKWCSDQQQQQYLGT